MIEWEIQFITDIHDVTTTSARTPVAAAASGRRLRKQVLSCVQDTGLAEASPLTCM